VCAGLELFNYPGSSPCEVVYWALTDQKRKHKRLRMNFINISAVWANSSVLDAVCTSAKCFFWEMVC
jgi:hypothetical protein